MLNYVIMLGLNIATDRFYYSLFILGLLFYSDKVLL